MVSADLVVSEARKWVGVPFRHQGRSSNGVDCIGLVIVVCRSIGVIPPTFDKSGYSRRPMQGLLEKEVASYCDRLETPEPGCIVMMRWTKEPQHVAIFTGENLIHSYNSVGKVVEHGFRNPWIKRTHSFWRLPGVTCE